LANPKAKKAAERSSKMGIVSIWGCLAKATVKGVDRDPGETTPIFNPKRANVSTKIEPQSVLRLRKSIDIYQFSGKG
jgi:hypothetical protein